MNQGSIENQVDLDEQQIVRLNKLQDLRSTGFNFPNNHTVNSKAQEIREKATSEGAGSDNAYSLAGRIIRNRLMGKAAFFQLQDISGDVQVYIKQDEVGVDQFEIFKSLDLGDIVQVTGKPFITKTGEPSLHASSFNLLVKCLHPLPDKWHGLTDVEIRYRKRYLDLIVNPEVKKAFITRSKIISKIREFFNKRDYLEVETPVLNSVASGASAKPFLTHHNALDIELNCRIALELPLKKLVVGGLERVYEIGRVFRNEGISTEHNPEFTMIEFYQAYATYHDLMDLTEELFGELSRDVLGTEDITFKGNEISLKGPFKRMTMRDAIYELGEISNSNSLQSLEDVQSAAKTLGLHEVSKLTDYGMIIYEIFDQVCQPKIINPVFVTEHPLSVSPLARKSEHDPRFTDRFELFICGMEVANAFSELNDADDQKERMLNQLKAKESGDEEAMGYDEDFISALEYGLPPTAGQGIGIDRLVMLLTGQESIRDVILFPTLKPQQ